MTGPDEPTERPAAPTRLGMTSGQWQACVIASLGIGVMISAVLLAAMSLRSTDTGSGPDYADVQWTVGVVLLVTSLGSLVVVIATSRVRLRWRRTLAPIIVIGCVMVGLVVALFCGVYIGREAGGFTGVSVERVRAGAIFLFLGGVAIGFWRFADGRIPRSASWWARLILVPVVMAPIVVTGALTRPWPLNEQAETEALAIERLDVRDLPSQPIPKRVSLTPGAVIQISKEDVGVVAVGPGVFTSANEMLNGDTGSVRWRMTGFDGDDAVVVINKASAVVVLSARRGGESIAVDALTGERRWAVPNMNTADQMGSGGRSIGSMEHLLAVSADARVMTKLDPISGGSVWHYNVGRDCAIGRVTQAPLAAEVHCVGTRGESRTIDPRSGRVMSVGPIVSPWDRPDRPECDGDDCIVTRGRGRSMQSVIVSSRGAHRDVRLSESVPHNASVLWLEEQILWSSAAGVTIADRRTGETTTIPGVRGYPIAAQGAVLVVDGGAATRLEGVTQ